MKEPNDADDAYVLDEMDKKFIECIGKGGVEEIEMKDLWFEEREYVTHNLFFMWIGRCYVMRTDEAVYEVTKILGPEQLIEFSEFFVEMMHEQCTERRNNE